MTSPLSGALVGVVMGSISDWAVMEHAAVVLAELQIPFETRILSAHRMPIEMAEYATGAAGRGLRAIVAGAGGAAHLPGMLAAHTLVPILGVPIAATALQGQDSLLSIVQMPAGVPVATFAIGRAGAINAALFAAAMLSASDSALFARLRAKREQAHDEAISSQAQLPSQAQILSPLI